MKTYYFKVIYVLRSLKKGKGVSQLGRHRVKAENEKEARLSLLVEYIKTGYRVLKIKNCEKKEGA